MRIQAPLDSPFVVEDADGWEGVPPYLDVNLAITAYRITSKLGWRKRAILTCQALHEGELVGFDLDMRCVFPWGLRTVSNWNQDWFKNGERAVLNPDGWVHNGAIIKSRGKETSRLFRFMSQHFRVKPAPLSKPTNLEEISLTAKSFSPRKHDITNSFSEIKLVFDTLSGAQLGEEAYWEAFIRIDPSIGVIRLEEKDISFRQAQINCLNLAFP